MVDASIETLIASPSTVVASPPQGKRAPLIVGGSMWHVAPHAIIAQATQISNRALSTAEVKVLMGRFDLPKVPRTLALPGMAPSLTPATEEMRKRHLEAAVQSTPVSPRGVRVPTGNLTGAEEMAFYVSAFLRGENYALLALGNMHYFRAGGAEESCSLSAVYYKIAAEAAAQEVNSADVQQVEYVRLSVETERGNAFEGHRGEEDDLIQYQQHLADSGDARAQAWLGHRYYWGAGGVPRDRERAFRYLDRAAAAGNQEAQYNLGVMHAYGHGVERNRQRGIELFRQAADSGYTPAQNGLAVSLTDGSLDNNFTEAFLYFDRSVHAPETLGSARICRVIFVCFDRAVRALVKCALSTSDDCRLLLGPAMFVACLSPTTECPVVSC